MSINGMSGIGKRVALPPVKHVKGGASIASTVHTDDDSDAISHRLKEVFNTHICGDIFGSSTGDSLLGLMYRARMSESIGLPKSSVQDNEMDDMSTAGEDSVATIEIVDDSDEEEDEVLQGNNARQQLALTIRNWSKHIQNHDHIIKEGAVQALIALGGVDDQVVKKACSKALLNLARVRENRFELIKLGVGTGIKSIQIRGGGIRRWSVAKSCALSMCYLSMEVGGEATLAQEGAVSCLAGLIGVRGLRLQPICVQAMYNLTCMESLFDQLERIPKIFLMLSPMDDFDPTDVVVKCLVNCARFETLRPRIIEDGAFNFFVSLVNNVGYRENRSELVQLIVMCLRRVSETKSCRADMISKGCIELLQQLLPFCNDNGFQLVVLTLYNLLQQVTTMPTAIFEVAVNVICELIMASNDELVLQYASSCFYCFTQEGMRNSSRLVVRCVKNLPKLLGSTEPLTQFYAIAASGNIFFNKVGNGAGNMNLLLEKFVAAGHTVSDEKAIRAMGVALAKMSKEASFMTALEGLNLLSEVLEILLKLIGKLPDDAVVQECACISVCSVALQLKKLSPDLTKTIADMFGRMIRKDSDDVVRNGVAAIRALIAADFAADELCTVETIARVAEINKEKAIQLDEKHNEMIAQSLKDAESVSVLFDDDGDEHGKHGEIDAAAEQAKKEARRLTSTWEDTCRITTAVIIVMSYKLTHHEKLVRDDVFEVLFMMTRSGDPVTRELAAIGLCNMSTTSSARTLMVENGVLDVLSALSSGTSELIQELTARTICNLACTAQLHKEMIRLGALETLNMIALVRAVSGNTKRLAARAFLNMFTEENMDDLVSAGVIRTLAALSTVDEPRTQHICARGFLIFTAREKGRADLVARRPAQQALYKMVRVTDKTRVVVGKAVCNMLSAPESCMSAVHSGALGCLKVIATVENEDLRECTARVIVDLSFVPSAHLHMKREPLIQTACLILCRAYGFAKVCAVDSILALSQVKGFRSNMVNIGCVGAMVVTALQGRLQAKGAYSRMCRCLYNLSFTYMSKTLVLRDNCLLLLHIVYRDPECSLEDVQLMAAILQNLTLAQPDPQALESVCGAIMDQESFKLLREIIKRFSRDAKTVCQSSIVVLQSMAQVPSLHERMVKQGFMEMLVTIAASSSASSAERGEALEPQDVSGIISAIDMVSKTASCRQPLVEGGAVNVFANLIAFLDENSRLDMAASIAALASSEECRQALVDQGANQLVMTLSTTPNTETQAKCALAMGYLSDITSVSAGAVGAISKLTSSIDKSVHDLLSRSNTGDLGNGPASTTASPAKEAVAPSEEKAPATPKVVSGKLKLKGLMKKGLSQARNVQAAGKHDALSLHAEEKEGARRRKEEKLELEREKEAEKAGLVLRMLTREEMVNSRFHIIGHRALAEEDGMAKKLRVKLPMPQLAAEGAADMPDRSSDLKRFPVNLIPLEKDLSDPKVMPETSPAVEENSTPAHSRSLVGERLGKELTDARVLSTGSAPSSAPSFSAGGDGQGGSLKGKRARKPRTAERAKR